MSTSETGPAPPGPAHLTGGRGRRVVATGVLLVAVVALTATSQPVAEAEGRAATLVTLTPEESTVTLGVTAHWNDTAVRDADLLNLQVRATAAVVGPPRRPEPPGDDPGAADETVLDVRIRAEAGADAGDRTVMFADEAVACADEPGEGCTRRYVVEVAPVPGARIPTPLDVTVEVASSVEFDWDGGDGFFSPVVPDGAEVTTTIEGLAPGLAALGRTSLRRLRATDALSAQGVTIVRRATGARDGPSPPPAVTVAAEQPLELLVVATGEVVAVPAGADAELDVLADCPATRTCTRQLVVGGDGERSSDEAPFTMAAPEGVELYHGGAAVTEDAVRFLAEHDGATVPADVVSTVVTLDEGAPAVRVRSRLALATDTGMPPGTDLLHDLDVAPAAAGLEVAVSSASRGSSVAVLAGSSGHATSPIVSRLVAAGETSLVSTYALGGSAGRAVRSEDPPTFGSSFDLHLVGDGPAVVKVTTRGMALAPWAARTWDGLTTVGSIEVARLTPLTPP